MGIVQENRFDAPKPEVTVTDYGASYVNAAKETSVAEVQPVVIEPEPEPKDVEAPVVVKEPVEVEKKPVKRAGRVKRGIKK